MYETIRNSGWKKLTTHTGTIKNFLQSCEKNSFSHFVLLDHMDWLHSNLKQELVAEWEEILRVAQKDAKVIFRSGGYKVEYLDPLEIETAESKVRLGSKLQYDMKLANELHEYDRVHTYGSFYVAQIAA